MYTDGRRSAAKRLPLTFSLVQKTGAGQLLKYLHADLRAAHTTKMRFGDYIPPSKGRLVYHIESGQAWRLDDTVTLTLLDNFGEDKQIEPGEDLPQDESSGQVNKRPAARTYKARSDASVGSIKSRIEEVFGLPEGSVALCAPHGKHMRSDAKIKTLRNRWGEE